MDAERNELYSGLTVEELKRKIAEVNEELAQELFDQGVDGDVLADIGEQDVFILFPKNFKMRKALLSLLCVKAGLGAQDFLQRRPLKAAATTEQKL